MGLAVVTGTVVLALVVILGVVDIGIDEVVIDGNTLFALVAGVVTLFTASLTCLTSGFFCSSFPMLAAHTRPGKRKYFFFFFLLYQIIIQELT